MAVAQTHEIQFATSMTPAVALSADEGNATKVMDSEVAKSLGGGGVVGSPTGDNITLTASGDDVTGWATGTCTHLDSNATPTITGATNSVVFIKNTGSLYDAGALGEALTKTAGVWTTDEAFSITVGTEIIAVLYPGEAITFPRAANSTGFDIANAAGTAQIAVEYAVIS